MSSAFKVAVLLCTYNGQAYLERQLQTLMEQDCPYIDIYVSDDGSSDTTLAILQAAQSAWSKGRFEVLAGPRQGFAQNFMSLVLNPAITADFYAYADQDDCWFTDKISYAVQRIQHHQCPALYCARTQLVDEQENPLGFSPLFTRPPSFKNALVQSIGGGNTMLFNQAARHLLLQADVSNVPSHDWWTYMLISGCGGVVDYDSVARMAYRQHTHNLVGSNKGIKALLERCVLVLKGRYRDWSEHNNLLLSQVEGMLSPEARHTLQHFRAMRSSSVVRRVQGFFKSGVHRQTSVGNVFLLLAVLMGRA